MDIPLKLYVKEHGQTDTATRLGLTQGAIWQMLRNDRNVVVRELPNGSIQAVEEKIISKASLAREPITTAAQKNCPKLN